jgi:ZIP family zinc transporter
MITLLSIATFLSTMIGGLFALRLRDQLHLILGFSAGAIIGVAFFDLIPEALELAGGSYAESTILALTALGFAIYLMFDRMILLHGHGADHMAHSHRGIAGAGSLSFHSFLDGIAIGLALQVSSGVAAIVAIGVLSHNFSDGINTVGMILKSHGDRTQAFRWLFVDALAPVLGILSTLFFTVPETQLGLLLALFAGSFLYIGASDLIPESYHAHPKRWTTIMTAVGICFLYVVIKLAGV